MNPPAQDPKLPTPRPEPGLLWRPPAAAGTRVAREQLDVLLANQRALERREHKEALHDFRVALRRLRTTLRAFQKPLEVPQALRNRLRRLARATSDCRNMETWRAWLSEQARTLPPSDRLGLKWLRKNLRKEHRALEDRVRREQLPRLPGLRRELGRLLATPVPRRNGPARARTVVRRALREDAQRLRQELRQVRSMEDREMLHEARITAKRIRYVLEPFAMELPGAAVMLEQLKALQEKLGDLHDYHLFGAALRTALLETSDARAKVPGSTVLPWANGAGSRRPPPAGARRVLLVLARRLRRDADRGFEELRKTWLGSGRTLFWRGIAKLGS